MKKIIGLAAITGVVVFAYLRSFNAKLGHSKLSEGIKEDAQLAEV